MASPKQQQQKQQQPKKKVVAAPKFGGRKRNGGPPATVPLVQKRKASEMTGEKEIVAQKRSSGKVPKAAIDNASVKKKATTPRPAFAEGEVKLALWSHDGVYHKCGILAPTEEVDQDSNEFLVYEGVYFPCDESAVTDDMFRLRTTAKAADIKDPYVLPPPPATIEAREAANSDPDSLKIGTLVLAKDTRDMCFYTARITLVTKEPDDEYRFVVSFEEKGHKAAALTIGSLFLMYHDSPMKLNRREEPMYPVTPIKDYRKQNMYVLSRDPPRLDPPYSEHDYTGKNDTSQKAEIGWREVRTLDKARKKKPAYNMFNAQQQYPDGTYVNGWLTTGIERGISGRPDEMYRWHDVGGKDSAPLSSDVKEIFWQYKPYNAKKPGEVTGGWIKIVWTNNAQTIFAVEDWLRGEVMNCLDVMIRKLEARKFA